MEATTCVEISLRRSVAVKEGSLLCVWVWGPFAQSASSVSGSAFGAVVLCLWSRLPVCSVFGALGVSGYRLLLAFGWLQGPEKRMLTEALRLPLRA